MSERCASHERFLALQRAMHALNNMAEKCAGLFLLGMIIAISVSVFARLLYTYTGIPLSAPWAEELARYLMVGSVFIGGAVAAYHLRLIGVDVFVGLVPERLARWLRLLSHLDPGAGRAAGLEIRPADRTRAEAMVSRHGNAHGLCLCADGDRLPAHVRQHAYQCRKGTAGCAVAAARVG